MRIIQLGLVFTVISCLGLGTSESVQDRYHVTRIDSVGNYYTIYASRYDSTFKIVSKKSPKKCLDIKVGSDYPFRLTSVLQDVHVGGQVFSPKENLLVTCFSFDEETTICYEDGCVKDLFEIDKANGLCWTDE